MSTVLSTMSSNDNLVVVAPRPVRLAATHFHRPHARFLSDRVKIADCDDISVDKDPSPRASPRSVLTTEALEEFLSILRPSFFPSASPTLRSCRSASLPTFQYDRSFTFRARQRLENASPKTGHPFDDVDTPFLHHNRNSSSTTPELTDLDNSFDHDLLDPRLETSAHWFPYGVLSSPISRTHTRNPFLRQASDYPPVAVSPLSPAAIPLPSPSPEEML